MTVKVKTAVYESFVVPLVMYGSETWELNVPEIRRQRKKRGKKNG